MDQFDVQWKIARHDRDVRLGRDEMQHARDNHDQRKRAARHRHR